MQVHEAPPMDKSRMELVMRCFDRLPPDLREWISNLDFSLHDDHILRGADEIRYCKRWLENGGKRHDRQGNGQN